MKSNERITKSEQLLEDWCSKVSWLWEKIPKEENSRTADYRINISGIKIYAEVKEILANDEEKKVIKQLEENGFSDAYGEEPGKTIRNKIQDSYKQIKRFTEPEKCSGILVLYNNSGWIRSFESLQYTYRNVWFTNCSYQNS